MEREFTSRQLPVGGLIADAVGFTPSLSSDSRGWRSASLYMWRGVSEECLFPMFEQPVIVFHTGGAARVPCLARGLAPTTSHPGLLTVIPPATAVTWEICGQVHSYTLHLAPQAFERLLERPSRTALEALRFRCAFSDPLLSGLIAAMAAEIAQPRELGSLYINALTDSMALHLLRGDSDETNDDTHSRGGLPPAALQRILDLIDNSIEAGISLPMLAQEAGFSRAWFAAAFRRSTGRSPHRYLTERRIETARQSLATTAKPICEIAIDCGFSSQAHFTEAFRRAVGATPASYRRKLT